MFWGNENVGTTTLTTVSISITLPLCGWKPLYYTILVPYSVADYKLITCNGINVYFKSHKERKIMHFDDLERGKPLAW